MWKKYETPELEIVSFLTEVTITEASVPFGDDEGLQEGGTYPSNPNTTLDDLIP